MGGDRSVCIWVEVPRESTRITILDTFMNRIITASAQQACIIVNCSRQFCFISFHATECVRVFTVLF